PFFFYEYDDMENPLRRVVPVDTPYIQTNDFFSANIEKSIEQRNKFSKLYENTYNGITGPLTLSKLIKEIIYTYNASGQTASSRTRSYPAQASDKNVLIYKY